METFKRPSIPPLPGIRSITSFHRRISIDRSSGTQRSCRISPASVRTESPGSGRSSVGPEHSLLRQSPLSTGNRKDIAEELMRQHMQIGNKVAFRAMSGAAKVTRSRLLENKCERALQAIHAKELQSSRLPPTLVSENDSSAFPCPLRSVLSLRGKADMRVRAKRDLKADLMRLFHERKN